MFLFTKRTNSENNSCDGIYIADPHRGTVNGKNVYINEEQQMLLAAFPKEGWCITSINYWEEIKEKQSSFGGLYFGGASDPHDGIWKDFLVCEIYEFDVSSRSASDDTIDCSGTYICDPKKGFINKKIVYVNEVKCCFMAAQSNGTWVITGSNYFSEVKIKQGIVGGFDFGGGSEPDDNEWNKHIVNRVFKGTDDLRKFENESLWHSIKNTTVRYKACSNSGVVRTNADLNVMRRRCLSLDCCGFAWRKPHFNQFQEEDDPPICFFFRKTQVELRNAVQQNDKFDLFIAPDNFTPNCTFKPGRDPAPSCHVWWDVGKMVHGFACQVNIAQPSQSTYYCVGGFDGGYCGIQQHNDKKQQILFSLWDHPCADDKVRSFCGCNGTVAKPFGGEGIGMQIIGVSEGGSEPDDVSIAKWLPGVSYTFVVRAYSLPNGTEYRCSVHKPESGWHELGRHVRPEPPCSERGKLTGLHSFIEDFMANSVRRSARYAAWVLESPGSMWTPVNKIRGTSTAEDDVPNKCVRVVSDGEVSQVVEMITGGDILPDCSLYKGHINCPSVPDILYQLQ